jgi:hypothetical protein
VESQGPAPRRKPTKVANGGVVEGKVEKAREEAVESLDPPRERRWPRMGERGRRKGV